MSAPAEGNALLARGRALSSRELRRPGDCREIYHLSGFRPSTIIIRHAEDESEGARIVAEVRPGPPAPAEKLLVVEDDPAIQQMMRDYFRHLGYEVVMVGDGEAGVKAAFEERPAALILDLMLPKLDGLGVCRQVRERNPRCRSSC